MKVLIYDEIRPMLKTGDSISFSGNGIASGIIRLATRSKWSHDAMVVRVGDRVFCWESTTLSKVKDIEAGIIKSGVQLVNLSQRIATYDGEIGIRRLRQRLTLNDTVILDAMMKEVRDVPYQRGLAELFKAAYDGPFGLNIEDLSSIFCSELKAEFYRRIKRLVKSLPANEYTPDDFANKLQEILDDMIMVVAG